MDGENNGKKTPYFLMDDLGGFNPLFLETSRCNLQTKKRQLAGFPALSP